eukprot:TRINITY_DN735_c0_g1_i6.p1 TRINITY_DN735_c0_g1~~TRINITY_DN735_c0_g1_i6.p1  ORF type:complete len:453 (-),score=88.28 TRINITY_DN735_c0_g1_i6:209-1567(-)
MRRQRTLLILVVLIITVTLWSFFPVMDWIFPQDCRCPWQPQPDIAYDSLEEFFQAEGCDPQGKFAAGTADFLKHWKETGIHPDDIERARQRHTERAVVVQIIDNKMYYYGSMIGDLTEQYMAVLLEVTRKVKLPNVELVISHQDWPMGGFMSKEEYPPPVFSFCQTKDHADILIDYGSVPLFSTLPHSSDPSKTQADELTRWEDKKEMMVWRGAHWPWEKLRIVLARESAKHPHIVDVGFTSNKYARTGDTRGAPFPTTPMSFVEQQKYKYVAHLPGNCASVRLRTQLSGTSLVFKAETSQREFFYTWLEPYVHYIPFHLNPNDGDDKEMKVEDAVFMNASESKKEGVEQWDITLRTKRKPRGHGVQSNVMEQIGWAMDNDEMAQQIVKNANKFAQDYLHPDKIPCWTAALLTEYSKLLKFDVQLRDGAAKNEFVDRCACSDERASGPWVRP